MAITKETAKTGFYEELPQEQRAAWLGLKRSKFLPSIDNLYYGVFVEGDVKGGHLLDDFIGDVFAAKEEAARAHGPVPFDHGVYCDLKRYTSYSLCLSEPELYDVFIVRKLPNTQTPRMIVQLRAMGLWTRGMDEILLESYNTLAAILADYGLFIEGCRESRIDYCYHTNALTGPDKAFRETRGRVRGLYTNLTEATMHVGVEGIGDGTALHKDYICFGSQKANNVRARIYDKVKEVIELGYKGFFFQLWKDNGLINAYDQWCMAYALPYKNMDYLHKARVAFYAEHGRPGERRDKFAKALKDKNTSLRQFKALADEGGFMPPVTAVVNIEYETKRKFYRYSDKYIDGFKHGPRTVPVPCALKRLYKILDNRSLFLDYLTSKTLSFHTKPDSAGAYKYAAWWERLRNTKLGGVKSDEKLLRDYSADMDEKIVMRKAVAAIGAASVYRDNVETGFVADISDMLADISDNDAHKAGLSFVSADGETVTEMYGGHLTNYLTVKAAKERLLKNRKRRRDEQAEAAAKAFDKDEALKAVQRAERVGWHGPGAAGGDDGGDDGNGNAVGDGQDNGGDN